MALTVFRTALLAAAAVFAAGIAPACAQSLVLYTSQPDKDAAETTAAFIKRNAIVASD